MGCGKSKLIKKIDELEEKLGDEQLANLKVKDTLLAKKEDVEARDQEIQALDAELQRKEAQALEQMKAEQAEVPARPPARPPAAAHCHVLRARCPEVHGGVLAAVHALTVLSAACGCACACMLPALCARLNVTLFDVGY